MCRALWNVRRFHDVVYDFANIIQVFSLAFNELLKVYVTERVGSRRAYLDVRGGGLKDLG